MKIINQNKQERPTYDHIRYGKGTQHFVLPPRNINKTDFEMEVYVMAIEKIKELQDRFKEIRDEYNELEPRLLSNKINISVNIRYLIAKFNYKKERYCILKWIKYWKDLAGIKEEKGFREKLDVERARSYPIEDLYKGDLRRVMNRLQGLCPFHEEKSPSFFIFEDNHFHCFGCSEHGSSIDFLMKTKNLDFVSAVKELQK
ncbi:MAG: CHC2 zinc finger domain-containing protein [Candidatus Microgenomates bacterium]|jgi:hypothetical protein